MKKILLIHPEGNINDNPNLTGIVEILCESGYSVEIVSPRRPGILQKPPCPGATIRLIDVPNFIYALHYSFAVPQDLAGKPAELQTYVNQNFSKLDLIIGVDRGIIDAFLISQAFNVPYGLISYEIYSAEEIGEEFKAPEIIACREISFAVCQDRLRSSLLSKENHILLDRIIDIPVAGRGFRPPVKRAFKLHELLNLRHDQKIALYMGSITSAWTMIGDLLKTIPDWQSEWILLLHHRYGHQILQKFLPQFPFLRNSNKVILSPFQQLDFTELPIILHDVDLGLAFYLPQKNDFTAGNNLKYIGMASGKIATYLQHGLPIMVNEIGLWNNIVRDVEIGCTVKNAAEVPVVLKNLTRGQLEEYKVNIQQFFKTSFDLNLTIQPLLGRLDEVLKSNSNTTFLSEKALDMSSQKTEEDVIDFHSKKLSLHDNQDDQTIEVSAIVSTYNSERFMRGCLEDLVDQTLYKKGSLEIIVIDSGSQQNERAIVEEFQQKYNHIHYIHTKERETVFAAWNRGIKAARGKYMTSANTDDRHRKDAMEVICDILENNPHIGLVYADVIITETPNETFEKHSPVGHFRWIDFDRKELAIGCFIGPQPVWRKSLHDKYGYFDERFSTSGDWEFWLRIAEGTDFLYIHESLGLYLRSPQSLEHRDVPLRMKEDRLVYKTYIPKYLPAYEEYIEKRLGADFTASLTVYRYGQILAALDKYDKAISLYTSFLQKNPNNQGFTFLIQDLINLKAQHRSADLPEEVMAYINQADTHIANNDLVSARKAIKQALLHASGHAQLSSMLSNILANLGTPETASKFLRTKGMNQ